MGKAAAKMLAKCSCPLQTPATPPIPHTAGGVVIRGYPTVLIGGMPAARVGDQIMCMGPPPHPDAIIIGSKSVLIGGLPAARKGDKTSLGGTIQMGTPSVTIGG